MISGISGANPYRNLYQYGASVYGASQRQTAQAQQSAQTQAAQNTSGVWSAQRASALETPVQPVRPATAVNSNEGNSASLGIPIRQGVDPVEMAVRMRIQYVDEPGVSNALNGEAGAQEIKSAQEVMEEGKCQTCEERKYQDGSDDMGVSFQTPTRIAPEMVASAVMGHEMEHVTREQAAAQREGRKVVSQSVTLHTDICPECGKAYISGGTTRTTTAAVPEQQNPSQQQTQQEQQQRVPFSAVA